MTKKPEKTVLLYMLFVIFSKLLIIIHFFSLFLQEYGFSLTKISLFFLTFQISKFIFEIPTGYLADKYGHKKSGIFGIILMIFSFIFLLFNIKELIYISFFLRGLAFTFISGSVESLFVNTVSEDKLDRYNVIERFLSYVSVSIALVFGGFLINYLGYFNVIIIDILTLTITLAIICMFPKEKEENNTTINDISIISGLKNIFKPLIILLLYLMDLVIAFSYVGIENLYAIHLRSFGLNSSQIGITIASQMIFSALFGFLIPKVQQYLTKEQLFYFFPVLMFIFTIPIYIANIPLIMVPVLYTLRLICLSLFAPIKYQIFQKNIDSKYRALGMSIQSIMIALGAMLFYIMNSILSLYLKENNIILIILSISLILIIVLIILIKKYFVFNYKDDFMKTNNV